MRPTHFHAKKEQCDGGAYDPPPPLKINRDSYFIKKPRLPPSSSPSSSSSSTTSSSSALVTNGLTAKPHHYQQPRQPVIIYTHSPKVIHTHPRDFMALVQKLTGYTPPPEETQPIQDRGHVTSEDDSTSVVTEEHGSSVNDIPRVNPCFVKAAAAVAVAPPPPPPPHLAAIYNDPCFNNIPYFTSSSTDFLCPPPSHQAPFYNYSDSLFLMPNMRNSFSSSSSSKFDGVKDFTEM